MSESADSFKNTANDCLYELVIKKQNFCCCDTITTSYDINIREKPIRALFDIIS